MVDSECSENRVKALFPSLIFETWEHEVVDSRHVVGPGTGVALLLWVAGVVNSLRPVEHSLVSRMGIRYLELFRRATSIRRGLTRYSPQRGETIP